jgi:hypothetical protein
MYDSKETQVRNMLHQYAYHTGKYLNPETASVYDIVKFEEWARSYVKQCSEEHRQRSHRHWLQGLVRRDRSTLASMCNVCGTDDNKLLHMVTSTDFVPHDDNIYRVSITGKKAEVVCLGLDSIDAPCTGDYYVSRLPKWIQKKLAVLLMLDSVPPNCAVDGVGIRIDEDTFWIFKNG